MRGHFPNNPRPPLVVVYGFTLHSVNSGRGQNSLRSDTRALNSELTLFPVSTKMEFEKETRNFQGCKLSILINTRV